MKVVSKLLRLLESIDRRGRRRLRTDVDVILSGNCGQSTARCVDLNRTGMGVLANQTLETGTLVFVRLPDCGLIGFAFVRRCIVQPEGLYLIGLEFRGALTRDTSNQLSRPDGGAWQCYFVRDTCHAWSAADDR